MDVRGAFIVLAVASADAAQRTATLPTGHQLCPCIDPFEPAPNGLGLVLGSNAAISSLSTCSITRSSDSHCFSASYGNGSCASHDLAGAPECVNLVDGERPDWCADMWCYVDPAHCGRPSRPSRHFPDATWGGSSLTYSYGTCGFLDDAPPSLVSAIQTYAGTRPDGKLRIAFPNNRHHFLKNDATLPEGVGVGGTRNSGAVPVFVNSIFQKHQIPWQQVPISAASFEASPSSSYTACAHEVGIGGADMCWANFLTTGERQSLAPFTGPIMNDEYFLVIKREAQQLSFSENLLRPFGPFTWQLWLIILLLLAFTGVSLTYEEGQHESFLDLVLSGALPVAILKGIMGFNSSEVLDVERKTSGSWLTTISLGFTVLVLTTGYSAVVTTTLVTQSMAAINTLSEAIAAGYTICAEGGVINTLTARYPDAANLLVLSMSDGRRAGILDDMDAGLCRAAILVDFQWYTGRTNRSVHCGSKIRLLETLLSVPVGMPVTQAIHRPVAALIQMEIGAGNFAPFVEQAKLNYTVHPCNDAGDASGQVTQFDLESMSGPLMLLFLMATISMIVTRMGQRAQAKADKLKAALDEDGDGVVTRAEVRMATKKSAKAIREKTRGRQRAPHADSPVPRQAPEPLPSPPGFTEPATLTA